jgi:periplasmic mercuric ion binding protein
MRRILIAVTAVLFSVAPLTVLAADTTGLKTVTLKVENMTCSACPLTVRKSLEKVPGVTKAKADVETKTATVTFDPAKTTVESLTRATTEAGYPSVLAR